MSLSALCTRENVQSRMADSGLATASTKQKDVIEVIDRKILEAHDQLELALIAKINKVLAPATVNCYGQDADTILTKIHNRTRLKNCAVVWTIYYMMEDGESRMRFFYESGADALTKAFSSWEKRKKEAFDQAWSLLRFDFNGDGTITTLEASFTNQFSSVSVTL